jgi:hypothetical protein
MRPLEALDLLAVLKRWGSSWRCSRGLSGEKLGKLVRDLSLVAMLLAELLG